MISAIEISAILSIFGTIGGASAGIWAASKWVNSVNSRLESVQDSVNLIANNHIPHIVADIQNIKIELQKLEDKIECK